MNEEQGKFWGGIGGDAWVELQEQMDGQLLPLGEAVMDAVAVQPGEHVLDVGCGCGATSIALAEFAGTHGSVVGCDISEPMLARAALRAKQSSLSNTSFVEADAQTAPLGGPFHVIFSRFGVMFFEDPLAAFENLRRATRAGGRLGFVCWQSPLLNEAFSFLGPIGNEILGPGEPIPPTAPGPFAFADPDYVRVIIAAAGWSNVEVTECRRQMQVFGTTDVEYALEAAMRIGPFSRRLIGMPPEVARRARTAVAAALESRWTPNGWISDGVCWLVTARN